VLEAAPALASPDHHCHLQQPLLLLPLLLLQQQPTPDP
jgi:hypothetical protein